MKEKSKDAIASAIEWTSAILYYPFFVTGWILHKVARFVLAIAYLLMLETQKATDIITNFTGKNGRKY